MDFSMCPNLISFAFSVQWIILGQAVQILQAQVTQAVMMSIWGMTVWVKTRLEKSADEHLNVYFVDFWDVHLFSHVFTNYAICIALF